MDTYALWHSKERRYLTLADLQTPCPWTVALYCRTEDAEYDIKYRVAPKDKPFVTIEMIG